MDEFDLVEVKPLDKGYGVFVNGELFGINKHSFACDFAAGQILKTMQNGRKDLHAELRVK